jgi:hypothetical protein
MKKERVIFESINELYDEPLSQDELEDASENLLKFFEILIEANNKLTKEK